MLVPQDGPEDDDSWMTSGAADLEAELAQRQKELEGAMAKRAKRTAHGLDSSEETPEFDPSEMVSKLNVRFCSLAQASAAVLVHAMSTHVSSIHGVSPLFTCHGQHAV